MAFKDTCPGCDKPCLPSATPTRSSVVIQCSICDFLWHAACLAEGKNANLFSTALNVIWICDRCVVKKNEIVDGLKQVKAMVALIEKCNEKIDEHDKIIKSLVEKQATSAKSSEIRPSPSTPHRSLSQIVKKNNSNTSIDRLTKKKAYDPPTVIKPPTIKFDRPPVIVLKPTDGNEAELAKIFEILDPTSDPVKSIKKTRDGGAVIICDDEKSVSTVKFKIQANMADKCIIGDSKQKEPLIKVIMPVQHGVDSDNIIEKIKKQNDFIKSDAVLAVESYVDRGKYIVVLVRADSSSFESIIMKKKLKIQWRLCSVYENITVLRCYQCSRYGHTANECVNDVTCALCAGKHVTVGCTSSIFKCINCMETNEKTNCELPCDHAAYSFKCPKLNKKWVKTKNQVFYKQ